MGVAQRATALALAGALAVAGSAAVASAAEAPDGHLVLIGGNLQEDTEILQRIVDLADPDGPGPQRARIAVVTAAASTAKNPGKARSDRYNNAAANGIYYSNLFQAFGADTYAVPIDTRVDWKKDPYVPANAESEAVAAEVRASTGVFFGGGDQMRYVRTLLRCEPALDEAFTDCEDTLVMAAIRDVLDGGGVVAGLSAGTTIQQGTDMVTGGESYHAWRDGTTPGYLDDATALAHLPYGGFGFFTEGLLDSHFTTWGRQARMIRLAAATGNRLAVGVDETTALVYDRAARTGSVIGRHGVSLLDLAGAEVSGMPGSPANGVRWTYLVAGDSVDFASGLVMPGSPAASGAGDGTALPGIEDAWDSIDGPGNVYSLRDLARALAASTATSASGVTFETDPQYSTTLWKTDGTRSWAGGFDGLVIGIVPTPS
jgi:cyanophycinase